MPEMLLSGFTVVRNAAIMGYPVVESIRSILPIVDEYVVGVGQSDDSTREMIEAIGDPKVKIFDSHWDTSRQQGGLILSEKTNEALDRCRGDWCFYLQADEVVHENDLEAVRATALDTRADSRVEGLLFRYVHFYGSFSVVARSRNWYRQEVRIVRRDPAIRSVGDAQSFMSGDRKLRVRWAGGTIYHYGHVKPPQKMGEKHRQMFRWFVGGKFDHAFDDFSYRQMYGLRRFRGSHPAVMNDLVAAQDWEFEPRFAPRDWNRKDYKNALSDIVERIIGRRLGERKKFVLLD